MGEQSVWKLIEAFGRRLGIPKNYAYLAWLGLGPLGLYPWSPPFPAHFHQIVGALIDPRDDGVTSPGDRDGLLRVHRRVTASVQALIDRARERVRNKEV